MATKTKTSRRRYAASIFARKLESEPWGTSIVSTHTVVLFWERDLKSAERGALTRARRRWPTSEGWSGHGQETVLID